MRRGSKGRFVVAAAACLVVGVGIGLYARAGMNVPTGIAYAGLLRDGNGNLVTGTHDLAFDLLNGTGASAGCATDARNNLQVTNGRFDVPDLFSACGTLDGIFASQAGLAIKITVDGTALSPAQPLGTTPFAARARVAETLDPPPAYAQLEGPTQTFQANAWTSVTFNAAPVANHIALSSQDLTFSESGTYEVSVTFRPDNGATGPCGDIWTAARLYGSSGDAGHSAGSGTAAPNPITFVFLATVGNTGQPYQLQVGRLAGSCAVTSPVTIAGTTPPAVQATVVRLGP